MKSYVGMEVNVCPVCMKKHTIGVLLDRRLKDSLERETVTGFSVCEECEDLNKQNYLALVGIDVEKSTVSNDVISFNDAYRTGRIMHVRRTAVKEIFKDIPDDTINRLFMFVDDSVITHLQNISK